jgi:sucrose phosphorylase
LNFTASHDGIGMRPAEGLLTDHEQSQLVETIRRHGGQFSTRRTADGNERIYELNVSLFDALKGTVAGEDEWQVARFLCSQTVMLGIEGLPAFYIHSLLATSNDLDAVANTGRARSINRHRWNYEALNARLADETSPQAVVLSELLRRIRIRGEQPAFHPNATQFTLQSIPELFGFWRQSRDRRQSIFAIHNMSQAVQELRLSDLNLIAGEACWELLSGEQLQDTTGTLQLQPYQCLWISNRR